MYRLTIYLFYNISCADIVAQSEMNSKIDPIGFLPLPNSTFHILLSLADAERHGYGIMQEVAERTGGQVKLGPGTLYGAIKRLLADGLIAESEERPDPTLDDERRRYYCLTDLGRRVIRLDAQRLADLVGMAEAKQLLEQALLSPNTGGVEL
jgi:DNA-binding PadR family transcriptional regulator